jgi:hypothetical protein
MMPHIFPALFMAVALAGCASTRGTSAAAPAASATIVPCPASATEPALAGWQQVRTPGFAICLPAGYSVGRIGSTGESRSGSDRLRWGTGNPPAEVGRATVQVQVRAGESVEDAVARIMDHREWTETLGGGEAKLSTTHVAGGEYHLTAIWRTPSIYLTGTAQDETSAALQLRAIRTIQFMP